MGGPLQPFFEAFQKRISISSGFLELFDNLPGISNGGLFEREGVDGRMGGRAVSEQGAEKLASIGKAVVFHHPLYFNGLVHGQRNIQCLHGDILANFAKKCHKFDGLL